jgi:hypothetical protein
MNRNTMKGLEADRAEREAELEARRAEREAKLETERAERQAKIEEDRAERQAQIEADRAEREARLESLKAARDEAAQRRLALGSLKLLKDELEDAQSNLQLEQNSSGGNPLVASRVDTQLHVRPEDKHAIATWVSDIAWRVISLTLVQVELVDALRAQARERLDAQEEIDADDYRSTAAVAFNRVKKTLGIIDSEIKRLGSA